MKLVRPILAILAAFMLLVTLYPAVQADNYTAEVELRVEIIALPSIITQDAYPITATSALLHGRLNSLGTASPVVVYFEWGTTIAYGFTTKSRTMTKPKTFSNSITGLTPDTTYHFRTVAVGEDGTSYGSDVSFTTRERWWWLKWLW